MKILNISTLFFLLWCTLFLLSCKSTDTKESLLIKKNNVLNAALSDKKWETIYKLKDEASQNKIGPSNWSKNWDQKSFIEEYSSHYFYGEISIKNLSYKILKDSAETINLIKIKTIPTKQVYEDTTYHYWIYKNDNWFLKDWDVRKNIIENELPDSVFNSIMEKILKK